MQKSKLGVSVGLLGAAAFLLTYFSGYMVAILLTGYVLLCEENEWLKKTCVKAVALSLCFSVVLGVIGLIPSLLSWMGSIVGLFHINFNYSLTTNILSIITKAINIVETCLFLIFGLTALQQKEISVPFVGKLVDKYF